MQWIEGVERRDGEWGIQVSESGGQTHQWQPARQIGAVAGMAKGRFRRRLTTDVSIWRHASAREYLAILVDERNPTGQHEVYSFLMDGTEYLVPAIVLIQALCRPVRYIAPWLFHPAGLELVSAPLIDGDRFHVELTLPGVDFRYSEPVSIKQQFTWLWAYPSARRMWASIYLRALQGRVGVTLPQATIRAVFHGHHSGNRVAVTEMTVMQLDANEPSDLATPPATNTFVLHSGVVTTPMQSTTVEEDFIRCLGGRSQLLSNENWEAVKDLIDTSRFRERRQHDPRLILEGVLAKLASGQPWRKLSYQAGDWRNISTAYRRWKTSGVWEEVCRRLLAARPKPKPLALVT